MIVGRHRGRSGLDYELGRIVYSRAVVGLAVLAKLKISSGAIAVGDPEVLNSKAFTRRVPHRNYPRW